MYSLNHFQWTHITSVHYLLFLASNVWNNPWLLQLNNLNEKVYALPIPPKQTNLFHKSSSSPPQPQNALGKPLILRNCSTVSPLTPPKNSLYGRLQQQQTGVLITSPLQFIQASFCFVSSHEVRAFWRHSHVHVFVQFGSEVARHLTTAVVVSVVLWDVVHIMEDQAVPVQVLHGLQESHIKQHGSVEGLAPTLNTHTHAHTHLLMKPSLSRPAFTI